jgi:hypothetical protein
VAGYAANEVTDTSAKFTSNSERNDLPPKSAWLVLRIYPVVGAVGKWETLEAFSKQTKSASFPSLALFITCANSSGVR